MVILRQPTEIQKFFSRFILIIVTTLFAFFSSLIFQNQCNANEESKSNKTLCNDFTFDATASIDPDNKGITYFWDFGDGTTSTEPVVNHVYEKPGEYTVSLSISDQGETECSTAVTTQKVIVNIPPQVIVSAPERVCAKETFTMDASETINPGTTPLKFSWNFSDGSTQDNKTRVSKSFEKGGTYKISVTADTGTGDYCGAKTKEHVVIVNEPPIANAGDDVLLRCVEDNDDLVVTFDATNSTDTNNDQLTYTWDFGDGLKETGSKVTHRFAEINHYDVKLIVNDNTKLSCSSSVDFITVKFNDAPKADAGDDIAVCPNEPVIFDGTKSFVKQKGTLGSEWFFGDGKSAKGLKVTHTYAKPGKYQASLQVENLLNSMCPPSRDTRNVVVNSPPSVEIKGTEASCVGSVVNFDASSASDPDGDELQFYWTFGDGTILKGGPRVSHEYKLGGNFRVTVIVDDGAGSACSTATAETTIKINTPPIADAGENLTCCAGRAAIFDGSLSTDADNDTLTYSWDFGDGTQEEGEKLEHAYMKSGKYNVVLTVDDNSGSACSKSTAGFEANVNIAPIPIINVR